MYNGGTMPLSGCKGTAIFRQNKKKIPAIFTDCRDFINY